MSRSPPTGSGTSACPGSLLAPALIATPEVAAVLDPGVREGGLAGLTGATVAVSREVARSRDAGLGRRIRLVLGDGTRTEARVAAVYDRGLGFGSLIVSGDLVAGHTTSGLSQSLLVRTDGTATAARALAGLTASRPGLTTRLNPGCSTERPRGLRSPAAEPFGEPGPPGAAQRTSSPTSAATCSTSMRKPS
ncbi:hypothetical protein ABT330_32960 [Streptomyces sp. NPDC000658]|uniref:hypothetical protein n=1 Tax=Streptomyces sp. NPDC000658 TaxID=3154266 RepID=UPI0033282ABE